MLDSTPSNKPAFSSTSIINSATSPANWSFQWRYLFGDVTKSIMLRLSEVLSVTQYSRGGDRPM